MNIHFQIPKSDVTSQVDEVEVWEAVQLVVDSGATETVAPAKGGEEEREI